MQAIFITLSSQRTRRPILVNIVQITCIQEEYHSGAKPEDLPVGTSIGFTSGFAITVDETRDQIEDAISETLREIG